jgi:hypothetical protein
MLTVCYGVKGGQGVTTVTAALALTMADPATIVIDGAGDLPAALGASEPPGGGLAAALGCGGTLDPAAIAALATAVGRRVRLVAAGDGLDAVRDQRWAELARALAADRHQWLLDAGTGPAITLAVEAQRALLVVRNCYLALRRAARHTVRPTGVVLVQEPSRILTARDVERVVNAPVVATVAVDADIARATEAGLLAGRLPPHLRSSLAPLTTRGRP